jgi:hypothetical protein
VAESNMQDTYKKIAHIWGEGYSLKVNYFKNKDKSGYEDMGRGK